MQYREVSSMAQRAGLTPSDPRRSALSVGVEIEVEGACLPDDFHEQNMWESTEDGSLRGEGIEFISYPMDMTTAEGAVRQFYEWHNALGFLTNVRTSTHVHVNMLHKSIMDVSIVAAVHALVEPALFLRCGPEREQNVYCVPWYRSPDAHNAVADLELPYYRAEGRTCKYSSLYLGPLSTFGTVEFRHAPVFDNANDLQRWIQAAVIICEGCEKYSSVDSVIDDYIEGTPYQFLVKLFGAHDAQWLLNGTSVEEYNALVEEVDSEAVAHLIAESIDFSDYEDTAEPQETSLYEACTAREMTPEQHQRIREIMSRPIRINTDSTISTDEAQAETDWAIIPDIYFTDSEAPPLEGEE